MLSLTELKRRYNCHRQEAAVIRLLSQLESLDDSNSTRSAPAVNSSAEKVKQRAAIRQELIGMGPSILFHVLKRSRHEGWYYRDDVYQVMSNLCSDLVDLFTKGIHHEDLEISWSSMKWLRDKAPPDARAIEALTRYIKNPVHKGQGPMVQSWATEPLTVWGEVGRQALLSLAADKSATYDAREAAVCSVNVNELNVEQHKLLEAISSDMSETEEMKTLVLEKLNENV